ncbi:hypothetical protein HPB47_010448 [Ixodes persulcatus]|uniref:Uncharacterized protein n=1 Tax=Ixodes persulcatus TaxID=34615 RepID=A0AC60NZD0_IXOPE|nr:hypothetical protein HPB47_010448 [Ixodes persulcatus]
MTSGFSLLLLLLSAAMLTVSCAAQRRRMDPRDRGEPEMVTHEQRTTRERSTSHGVPGMDMDMDMDADMPSTKVVSTEHRRVVVPGSDRQYGRRGRGGSSYLTLVPLEQPNFFGLVF